MKISEETLEMLNRFLKELFGGNARIDNIVYNLQSRYYNNLANAIHEPVAHLLPIWADQVTDLIDSLGGRPVRYGIPDYIEEYDVKEAFANLADFFDGLREKVITIIEELEGSGKDTEVRVFMEDFLKNTLLTYVKQSDEWRVASEHLTEYEFNTHIGEYTHYLIVS